MRCLWQGYRRGARGEMSGKCLWELGYLDSKKYL